MPCTICPGTLKHQVQSREGVKTGTPRHITGMRTLVRIMTAICLGFPLCQGVTQSDNPVVVYWDADRPSHGWRDCEWQQGGSSHTEFDTQCRKHGRASLRIEGRDEREVFYSSVSVPAPVDRNREYCIRFWCRREGGDGKASFQVLAHTMIDERRSRPVGWVPLKGRSEYLIPASHEWQRIDIPLKQFPGRTDRLYFYFRAQGHTTLWIDEFSLAEAGVEVQLGGTVPVQENDMAGIRLAPGQVEHNLLRNPGFEEGLKHWQTMGKGPEISTVKSPVLDGKQALRINAFEFIGGGIFQRVRIDPRYRYRLSYHIRCTDLKGYVFTKVLRFDRDNHPRGWLGGEVLATGTTQNWETRTGTFDPTPRTDNVVIYLRVQDTIGEAYLDNIRLEALPRD